MCVLLCRDDVLMDVFSKYIMELIFREDNIRFCGLLGTVCFSFFFLICIFRFYSTLRYGNSLTKGHGRRTLFHTALMTASSFELIYSTTLMIYDTYTVLGYSFHIVALFCNIVAFSLSASSAPYCSASSRSMSLPGGLRFCATR